MHFLTFLLFSNFRGEGRSSAKIGYINSGLEFTGKKKKQTNKQTNKQVGSESSYMPTCCPICFDRLKTMYSGTFRKRPPVMSGGRLREVSFIIL